MGLEMMTPLVNNLSKEVKEINDVLPKIFGIKSEVCNTADTMRSLKIDVMDSNKKFAIVISSLQKSNILYS